MVPLTEKGAGHYPASNLSDADVFALAFARVFDREPTQSDRLIGERMRATVAALGRRLCQEGEHRG